MLLYLTAGQAQAGITMAVVYQGNAAECKHG
jgi:hypothetical protein